MKHSVLLVLTGLSISGCVSTLVPHTAYLPSVQRKGDIEAKLASNLNLSRVEGQAGYQLTEQLVLHTAVLGTRRSGSGRGFLSAELGAGYYRVSPNGLWRLGLDAGVAQGGGRSSSPTSCFECAGDRYPYSEKYQVRYSYGYVQPTVQLKTHNLTWGVAFRIGQAYYHRLEEMRMDSSNSPVQTLSHSGHLAAFVQPTFQLRDQIRPWLAASVNISFVEYLGPASRLDNANPMVTQLGVHLMLNKRDAR